MWANIFWVNTLHFHLDYLNFGKKQNLWVSILFPKMALTFVCFWVREGRIRLWFFFYKIPFVNYSYFITNFVGYSNNVIKNPGILPLFRGKWGFTMVKIHQNQVTQTYTILTQYNYINMFLYCCSFVHLDTLKNIITLG